MKKFSSVSLLTVGLISSCVLLGGCDSSTSVDPNTVAGTQLQGQDGHVLGTVTESSEAHTFENGQTEPGVKIDLGTDENGQSKGETWLPQRSADTLSPSQ